MNYIINVIKQYGAWLCFAIGSVLMYVAVFDQACYFTEHWPFCGKEIGLDARLVQGLCLVMLFVWLGWGWNRLVKDVLSSKFSKISYVPAVIAALVGAFLTLPFSSIDISYYFNVGNAFSADINPYTEEWSGGNRFLADTMNQYQQGVMYGPLVVRLFSVVASLTGSIIYFTVVWKLLMMICLLLCGWLVYRLTEEVQTVQSNDKYGIVALIILQPLLLFEWVVAGHFDGLWLLAVLGSLLLAIKKKWFWVLPLLALAVNIKLVPILLVPWFLVWWLQTLYQATDKNMHILKGLCSIVVSALCLVLPWVGLFDGAQVFGAIALQTAWAVNSWFAALYYGTTTLLSSFGWTYTHMVVTGVIQLFLLTLFIFLLYPLMKTVWQVVCKKKILTSAQYIVYMNVSLLAYLIIWQKSMWPWYFAWFLPIFAVLPFTKIPYLKRIICWLGVVPLFVYPVFMFMGGDAPYAWFYLYCALICLYPVIQLFRWRNISYDVK